MEKKLYVSPDAELIRFASEDIMTASKTGNDYKEDVDWDNWEAGQIWS